MTSVEAESFGKQADKPQKDDAVDLRVLPVLFDAAEERWRTLSEAIPEYEEVDFDDFPLSGPRTVFRDVRQLRRQGMDFVQRHESWPKKSGVRSSNRSVYERASLCRALKFMASYDQLNLPSLASAEALNRRRTLQLPTRAGLMLLPTRARRRSWERGRQLMVRSLTLRSL